MNEVLEKKMNTKDIIENVNIVLDKLSSKHVIHKDEFFKCLKSVSEAEFILNLMLSEDFISDSRHRITLLKKGHFTHDGGGYGKYLETKKTEHDLHVQNISSQNSINEWFIKTKWWPLKLSAAAILISLISVIINVLLMTCK